jgi:hypothetical protein
LDDFAEEMMEDHNKNKKTSESSRDSDIRSFRNQVVRLDLIRILNEGVKINKIKDLFVM